MLRSAKALGEAHLRGRGREGGVRGAHRAGSGGHLSSKVLQSFARGGRSQRRITPDGPPSSTPASTQRGPDPLPWNPAGRLLPRGGPWLRLSVSSPFAWANSLIRLPILPLPNIAIFIWRIYKFSDKVNPLNFVVEVGVICREISSDIS